MTFYKLAFGRQALKEWNALDTAVKRQFQKKLEKVLKNPHVPSMRLHGWANAYRIKLRKACYRLGYKMIDEQVLVMVIAVGRRDKDEIYEDFGARSNAGEP